MTSSRPVAVNNRGGDASSRAVNVVEGGWRGDELLECGELSLRRLEVTSKDVDPEGLWEE